MEMVVVILIAFIGFWIFIIVGSSIAQRKETKRLLEILKDENLIHARVSFRQVQASKLSFGGGLPKKAELFFNKELIMICPKNGNLFNGVYHSNLPVIFAKDSESLAKRAKTENVINPKEIEYKSENTLSIKYGKGSFIDIEYSIKIRFQENEKVELSNQIRLNSLFQPIN